MPTKTPPTLRHFHGGMEHEHPYTGVHNHTGHHQPSSLPEETVERLRRTRDLLRRVELRWPAAGQMLWHVFALFREPRSPRQVAQQADLDEATVRDYARGLAAFGLLRGFPDGSFGHAPDLPPAVLAYAKRRKAGGPPVTVVAPADGARKAARVADAGRGRSPASPRPAHRVADHRPAKARDGKATATGAKPKTGAKAGSAAKREARARRRARAKRAAKGVIVLALLGGLGAGGLTAFRQVSDGVNPVTALLGAPAPADDPEDSPPAPPATREEAEGRFVDAVRSEARDLEKAEADVLVNYGESICERLAEGAPVDQLRDAAIAAGRPPVEYDAMFDGALRYLCPEQPS